MGISPQNLGINDWTYHVIETSVSYKLSPLEKQFVFIHWSLENKINFIRANLISRCHYNKEQNPGERANNIKVNQSPWTNEKYNQFCVSCFHFGQAKKRYFKRFFRFTTKKRPPLNSTDKRMKPLTYCSCMLV